MLLLVPNLLFHHQLHWLAKASSDSHNHLDCWFAWFECVGACTRQKSIVNRPGALIKVQTCHSFTPLDHDVDLSVTERDMLARPVRGRTWCAGQPTKPCSTICTTRHAIVHYQRRVHHVAGRVRLESNLEQKRRHERKLRPVVKTKGKARKQGHLGLGHKCPYVGCKSRKQTYNCFRYQDASREHQSED